jgi:hypothetical protein
MVSGLKWQFGFGWGSVSFFVAFVIISLASSGIVRWVSIVITILAFAFLVVQYKNWNTKGWRQVHGRAMQLYVPIAAKETINAKRANREFSHVQACRELGLALTGKGREVNVEAMISALQHEQGSYLASLFERHARELLPNADAQQVSNFSDVLHKVELGPQLVVANVVENTYGGLEGARYALALLKAILNERPLTGTLSDYRTF